MEMTRWHSGLPKQKLAPLLLLAEEIDQNVLNQVYAKAYAPDLSAMEIQQAARDPFLVAYAFMGKEEARCVVTREVSKPSKTRGNRKVPDACDNLGVRWMTDFEFYREHDFRIR